MKRGNRQAVDSRPALAFVCSLMIGMITLDPSVCRAATTVPVEVWVAHYNGPADGYDRAEELVTDAAGNVYVTGFSDGVASGYDMATIKYDTNGNELWVARYNGLENEDDHAYSLAVDPAGNVYITGSGTENGTGFSGFDYVTIKYDPEGNELWVARYNGPGNEADRATSLNVDGSGNAYVTGFSIGDGTDGDVATVKYDTDGNELWVARYNGPGNGLDGGTALKTDSSGNVYVTGSSEGDGTDSDYVTIKYDTDGNEVWVARFNSLVDDYDSAEALALDGEGYVYVTGCGTGAFPGDIDYVTIKYDTDGN